MKHFIAHIGRVVWVMGLLLVITGLVGLRSAWAAEAAEYHTVGTFIDGCSCSIPCTCEMGGTPHGCQGVGVMAFTSGSYKGVDLAGAKVAYATAPGNWIRFYVDSKSPQQEEAVTALAKGVFHEFGKVEAVKKASVALTGKAGHYTLSVDGGKIIELTTEPVLGGDKKTPLTHGNIFNPLSPTVMQGKTVKASFHDGDRSFTLGGSNAYFNAAAKSSGKV